MSSDGSGVNPPRGVRTMAVIRWVFVALAALVAVISIADYVVARRAATGTQLRAGAKVYYCPMHPEIVQDHPGDCPICGMTLVPRPPGSVTRSSTMDPARPADAGAGAAGGGATDARRAALTDLAPIDIPLDRVQKIGVKTASVVRKTVVNDLRTVGVIQVSERGLAQVSPRFSGWVEQLFVSETGQRVRRGQALATIYSPEVLQAQQELLTVLGWTGGSGREAAGGAEHGHVASAENLASDARRRLELLGVSPEEIEAIARTRKPQRALPIRSPVDGHVVGKNIVAGMSVSPGVALFEVADLSTVWVVAEVYESDVHRIRIGQVARFQAASYPGELFRGKVQFVYPTLDPSSRTLRLRLEFRNRPGPAGLKLRPGMYGDVLLDLPASSGLMVPAEAVVDTGQLQYVFVVTGEGHYEPRLVRGTARGDDLFEVLEGLREGEVVVTTAGFLIDSESRLRAAIQNRAARSRPGAAGSAPVAAPTTSPDAAAATPKQPAPATSATPAPAAPGHVH